MISFSSLVGEARVSSVGLGSAVTRRCSGVCGRCSSRSSGRSLRTAGSPVEDTPS